MVFLVGIKSVAISIEAEGFAKKPIGIAHEGLILLIVRLIAEAYYPPSVGKG